MQVKFNLDVERLLPDSIRRRFILKQETLYPNMRTGLLSKLVQDDKLLKMITETVLANRNEVRKQPKLLLRNYPIVLPPSSAERNAEAVLPVRRHQG